MKKNAELAKKLGSDIQVSPWSVLEEYNERGAVILLDSSLELIEAAVCIALDDSEQIEKWMAENLMGRPLNKDINIFKSENKTQYNFIIIRPYVLVHKRPLPT